MNPIYLFIFQLTNIENMHEKNYIINHVFFLSGMIINLLKSYSDLSMD